MDKATGDTAMITQELEWVNILRHQQSGELYLSTDGEDGGINRICGPVAARDLFGDVNPNWDADDVEWARDQRNGQGGDLWTLLGTLADLRPVVDEHGMSQPSPLALQLGWTDES